MKLHLLLACAAIPLAGGSAWLRWGTSTTEPESRELAVKKSMVYREPHPGGIVIHEMNDEEPSGFELEFGSIVADGASEDRVLDFVRREGVAKPHAALEVLLKQSVGYLRMQALLALVASWARIDPEGAASTILWDSPAEERDRLFGQVVGLWVLDHPETCLAWLINEPMDSSFKDFQLQVAYAAWARCAPDEALDHLLESSGTTENLQVVFAAIADADFSDAMERYELLLDSERMALQESMILIGAGNSAPETELLIEDFLTSHEDQFDRIRLGRDLVGLDPDLALRIVESGVSSEEKQWYINRIFRGAKSPSIAGQTDSPEATSEIVPEMELLGSGQSTMEEATVSSINHQRKASIGNAATR